MKNITVKRFILLKTQEYNFLNHIKGKDNFPKQTFSLDELTYNEVRKVERLLDTMKSFDDLKEVFKTCYKCTDKSFLNLPIKNFFQIKNFIIEKFVNLAKQEVKLLASIDEDSELWKSIESGRLKPYGTVLPLDRLAKIYGGYPLYYGDKKYVEIIFLLKMNSTLNKVEKEFNQFKYKNK